MSHANFNRICCSKSEKHCCDAFRNALYYTVRYATVTLKFSTHTKPIHTFVLRKMNEPPAFYLCYIFSISISNTNFQLFPLISRIKRLAWGEKLHFYTFFFRAPRPPWSQPCRKDEVEEEEEKEKDPESNREHKEKRNISSLASKEEEERRKEKEEMRKKKEKEERRERRRKKMTLSRVSSSSPSPGRQNISHRERQGKKSRKTSLYSA